MPAASTLSEIGVLAAGIAAAMVSVEYHIKNVRSIKFINVHEMVDTTSGRASTSTSRPPHGRFHHVSKSRGVVAVAIA